MRAGPEITRPGDPERTGAPVNAKGRFLDHPDPVLLERGAHARVVQPRIVVAEHGEDAEGRAQLAEAGRNLLWRNDASALHALDDEIAEDADQVRLRTIRLLDHPLQTFDSIERRTDMKVRE